MTDQKIDRDLNQSEKNKINLPCEQKRQVYNIKFRMGIVHRLVL